MSKFIKFSGPVALVLVLLAAGWFLVVGGPEEPVARSQACLVHTEQGCAKYVVLDGGEIEVQSGGILDVQSGATFNASAVTGNVDVSGTFNYGSDNLYPLGYASSGQQAVYGTSAITGTATAAHGLTTVTFALCTLGRDPDDDAGDAAMCTLTVSANVVTLKTWQDDFVTAATEADIDVHWLVIGAP